MFEEGLVRNALLPLPLSLRGLGALKLVIFGLIWLIVEPDVNVTGNDPGIFGQDIFITQSFHWGRLGDLGT